MLFPDCDFKFSFSEPALYLGRQISGQLEVIAKEDIARAEVVFITYTVNARAMVMGSKGQSRPVQWELAKVLVRHDLLPGGLSAGSHVFPFTIDPPYGLPPTFEGCDTAVGHQLEARVDVDWASDPVERVRLNVLMPPVAGSRAPFATRTPPSFHKEIVLEISLVSSYVVEGEPIRGQIALRGGAATMDSVVVDLLQAAGCAREMRRGRCGRTVIPRESLLTGEPVPFLITPDRRISPSYEGAPVSMRAELAVSADIPWALDPSMTVALHVVPRGSTLQGTNDVAPVGAARVQLSAAVMARRMGLAEGRPPVLAEGAIGPVWIRVCDAPHGARMGVRADLRFPDTEMGMKFGPRGWLDQPCPALSPALAKQYVLSYELEEHAPPLRREVADGFASALCAGLDEASAIHLGDDHLTAHFTLADDDGARIAALASFLRDKAERIGAALAALPPAAWMTPRIVDAWRAAAVETPAFLIASVPKLSRIPVSARLFGGVEVTIFATVGTAHEAAGARTVVEVDLSAIPLPPPIDEASEVGGSAAIMAALRAVFPDVDASGARATLSRPGLTEDPRPIVPLLGELLSWVIEVRGLRREAAAPYR